MRTIAPLWLLFAACLLGQLTVTGRNYYLDNHGNDGNDGSRGHPLRTIEAISLARLLPGDSVFFRGGQMFAGVLRIEGEGGDMPVSGTKVKGQPAERWIWVGSYGPGVATIRAGDSSAVVLYHDDRLCLHGLRLEGSGRKTGNVKDGLAVMECRQLRVEDIDITGFQKSGLFIYASVGIVAQRVDAHENGAAGIGVEGSAGKRSTRDIRLLWGRGGDNPGGPH